jgi:hypothetical protein
MSDTGPQSSGSLISRLLAWEKAPFTAQMSLMTFGLLVVLGITIAILWTRILGHIVEA